MPLQATHITDRDGYKFFDRYSIQRAFFEDVIIGATITVFWASADADSRAWFKALCRHLYKKAAPSLPNAFKREDDEEDITLPAGDDYWDFIEIEGSREKEYWRFTGLSMKRAGADSVEIAYQKKDKI